MKTELKRKKCQADRAQAISEPKAMRRSVKLTQVDTLLFFPLNWSIVALEGCVSFFYTAKRISYTHTHTRVYSHSVSHVRLCATPWIAHQVPLSMGFSRQEYWSGLSSTPGALPNPGIEPASLVSYIYLSSFLYFLPI